MFRQFLVDAGIKDVHTEFNEWLREVVLAGTYEIIDDD